MIFGKSSWCMFFALPIPRNLTETAQLNNSYRKESQGGLIVYSIVGYTTLYPFYYHPERIRMRIRFDFYGLVYGS
jgi:hypothetical protein